MNIGEKEMESLKEQILEEMDLTKELLDDEIYTLIEEKVETFSHSHMITLGEREELERKLFHSMRKFDAIQELLEDDTVTEIMVNGAEHIFYEKDGRVLKAKSRFSSRQRLDDVIQQMVGNNNRMVNEASPIVDTRLPDGSRVNIVLEPISIDGSAISIRKFPKSPMRMEDLVRIGSLSDEAALALKRYVESGYNIFVSGGTGSGKTTFLNAMSQYIPEEERIITIEDSAELQLQDKPNLIRLETRNANTEGVVPITIRDLIRTALRMRPERIIVGECRGAEALDMLQAIICTI